MATLRFERSLLRTGIRKIAGIDEAGRGPLAGPVVAAVAMLPQKWIEEGMPKELRELNDSKQLSAEEREDFFEILKQSAGFEYDIAIVEASIIDQVNILQATYRAMIEALKSVAAEHLLVDGWPVPLLPAPQTALVGGDGLSYSIAAASVLAKVTRDRLMIDYDPQFPEYGFIQNKGYGTPMHLAALAKHGPCAIHRRSFSPVRWTNLEFAFEEKLQLNAD